MGAKFEILCASACDRSCLFHLPRRDHDDNAAFGSSRPIAPPLLPFQLDVHGKGKKYMTSCRITKFRQPSRTRTRVEWCETPRDTSSPLVVIGAVPRDVALGDLIRNCLTSFCAVFRNVAQRAFQKGVQCVRFATRVIVRGVRVHSTRSLSTNFVGFFSPRNRTYRRSFICEHWRTRMTSLDADSVNIASTGSGAPLSLAHAHACIGSARAIPVSRGDWPEVKIGSLAPIVATAIRSNAGLD